MHALVYAGVACAVSFVGLAFAEDDTFDLYGFHMTYPDSWEVVDDWNDVREVHFINNTRTGEKVTVAARSGYELVYDRERGYGLAHNRDREYVSPEDMPPGFFEDIVENEQRTCRNNTYHTCWNFKINRQELYEMEDTWRGILVYEATINDVGVTVSSAYQPAGDILWTASGVARLDHPVLEGHMGDAIDSFGVTPPIEGANLMLNDAFRIVGESDDLIVVNVRIENSDNLGLNIRHPDIRYYLVSADGGYYERSLNITDAGPRVTCPLREDSIPAFSERDVTFCYAIPKTALEPFKMEMLLGSPAACEGNQCPKNTLQIRPAVIDPVSSQDTFLGNDTRIDAHLEGMSYTEMNGFSLMVVNVSITNVYDWRLQYDAADVRAIAPNGLTFEPVLEGECHSSGIDLNPRVTKSYSFCFEVPVSYRVFDITVRSGDCTAISGDCTEHLLTVDAGAPPSRIPSWVKQSAEWWSEGSITDGEFISGIEYLMSKGIIHVDGAPRCDECGQAVPSWVKQSAMWWADGLIGDQEFVRGLEYLISQGLIRAR